MSLDLNKLADKLDSALNNETTETLTKFLTDKMSNNKQSSVDKEFVSYEEALALKQLGFNEPCYKYIYIGDTGINVDHYLEVEPSKARNYNEDSLCISQPTWSQAFRWFREKYNKLSAIDHSTGGWYFVIREIGGSTDPVLKAIADGGFKTHEEAEFACLRKLIKIVEETRRCSVTGNKIDSGWVWQDGEFYTSTLEVTLSQCRLLQSIILHEVDENYPILEESERSKFKEAIDRAKNGEESDEDLLFIAYQTGYVYYTEWNE